MRQRTLVVLGWWIITALFAIYFILASVNSKNVGEIHGLARNLKGFDTAVTGSTMTTAVFSAVYSVLTGFNLIGRWCSADVDIGTWYGVSVASAFFMSGLHLNAALVAWGYYDKAQMMQGSKYGVWTLGDTNVLRGVYVLGFLLCALLVAYGFVLLCCRAAFGVRFQESSAPRYQHDYEVQQSEAHMDTA